MSDITPGSRFKSLAGARWRRVEIRNFRSIAHVKVDLAPFTLVVGPNGSGKSNFVDALVLTRDVGIDASTAVDKRGGIASIRRWRPKKPTDVTIDVRAAETSEKLATDHIRHIFTLHSAAAGTWNMKREEVCVVRLGAPAFSVVRQGKTFRVSTGELTPHRTSARQLELSNLGRIGMLNDTSSVMPFARAIDEIGRNVALRQVRRIRLNPEAMRLPQPAGENTRLEENGANIAVAYRSLTEPSRNAVLSIMSRIVPGLSKIEVESFDRFLILRFFQTQSQGELAPFSGAEMSEGAIRALGIVVAAQQMTWGELLIIEEPEVAIHVGAARLLFEALKKASTRGAVLVTTHSPDLLDAAKAEEILVCDFRDGETHIGPLAESQRQVVREGLFSVAELMRSEPLRIEGQSPKAVQGA